MIRPLSELKVGDIATRYLCGIPMKLKVTAIENRLISCGPWQFDLETGAEVDEELGWNQFHTGSVLRFEVIE